MYQIIFLCVEGGQKTNKSNINFRIFLCWVPHILKCNYRQEFEYIQNYVHGSLLRFFRATALRTYCTVVNQERKKWGSLLSSLKETILHL